jgi:hypothetical protein
MDIHWLGGTSFRIASEDGAVLTNPPPRSATIPPGLLQASVVTFERHLPAPNRVPDLPGSPFVVDGPGEYEVGGAFLIGVPVPGCPSERDEVAGITAFVITMEGLTVCHLGKLAGPPTQEQVEAIGAVDVLLVPVGGGETIGPAQAVEVVNQLEPALVVPMYFRSAEHPQLEPVSRFFEEMGAPPSEPLDRLSVSRAKLPLEPQVVLLGPVGRPGQ